jgi:thiamine pyrophosphate-dependent acetolactate synthase large subunit-like protein
VLVLAGRGSIRAGAGPALLALAERTGAVVGTTLGAKDLFRGEPDAVGVVGGFSHPPARTVLAEVDCVVAFGAGLNSFTTGHGALFGDARFVHVDAEPSHIGRYRRVDAGVAGDAREAAERLLELVRDRRAEDDGWRRDARDRLAAYDPTDHFEDASTGDAVDPRTLALELDRLLPPDRVLVADGGHFTGYPGQHVSVADPGGYGMTVDFGSIGLTLPAAMGVAVARPDRTAVAFVGDGGLMMGLSELDTAARYALPMVIVVMDDHAYGAEKHFSDLAGISDHLSVFPDVDLAALAVTLGIESRIVRSAADLEGLGPRLARREGPILLDCKILPDLRDRWYEELIVPAAPAL